MAMVLTEVEATKFINRAHPKIIIQITGQDGDTLMFVFPRELKLRVLFDGYCRRKQLDNGIARFFHEGGRVLGRCTPDELNLEDGAELNCMLYQSGGGFYTMPATT